MDLTLDSIRDIKIYQSKTGYRFSVDSLLLSDFVNLKTVRSAADLGSGSGIVGILIAKKYPKAKVDLFELQTGLADLSEQNIRLNNLKDRMQALQCDIRTIPALYPGLYEYELAVSNPPFRKPRSGRINVEEERAIARHELRLSLSELVDASYSVLKAKGRFCIIYHPCRLSELIETLKKRNLEPKRLRFVHSKQSSEAKMVLVEAVKGGRTGLKVENPLFLYNEDGSYTEEMREIYG
jgi:tRNA1Val (adenine37-N6)-methyltransferase